MNNDGRLFIDSAELNNKEEYISYRLDSYHETLSKLIQHISTDYNADLTKARNKEVKACSIIKNVIKNYLSADGVLNKRFTPGQIEQMTDEYFLEIADNGVLTKIYNIKNKQEIFINAYHNIKYKDKNNIIHDTPYHFRDERHLCDFIQRLYDKINVKFDETNMRQSKVISDGVRLTAIHKNLGCGHHSASLRFQEKSLFTVEDQIHHKTIDERIARILRAAIKHNLLCLIYGETSSGKTGLLGTLITIAIEMAYRSVLIGDTDEFQLMDKFPDANTVSLTAIKTGKVTVTLEDCVETTLRLAPDLIFFNELLDKAIYTFLDAAITGHGGATGIHGNTLKKASKRCISLMRQYNPEFSDSYCLEFFSSAIDLMVQMKSIEGGKRCMKVFAVEGFDSKGDPIEHIISEYTGNGQWKHYPIPDVLLNSIDENNGDSKQFLADVGGDLL